MDRTKVPPRGAAAHRSSTDPITVALEELCARVGKNERGVIADYIPELAKANPRHFGIALVSLAGAVYDAGDAAIPFTLQSVSKPFVYALALADRGLENVLSRVGAEPSGDAFNAISLAPGTGRPDNPMINAGAIVTTSLVRARDASSRFERIREALSAFAGRTLEVDEAVYRSELETGDRNRAMAYLMRSAGSLRASVEESVAVYFRQCAVSVTTVDVAVMAATLANGGTNPCTKARVIAPEVAEHVLSVMATCGMYDYAGQWFLRVGLPAKSGVSGGLVAVSPGQFGIGLFSPPLDDRGNSVRAVVASHELADRFSLHMMHSPGKIGQIVYANELCAVVRTSPASSSASSSRKVIRNGMRTPRTPRDEVRIMGIQGDIEFAAAEAILRALTCRAESERALVIDVRRVTRMHPVASRMIASSLMELARRGCVIVSVDPERRRLLTHVDAEVSSSDEAVHACFERLCVGRRAASRATLDIDAGAADGDRLVGLRAAAYSPLGAHAHPSWTPAEDAGRTHAASARTRRAEGARRRRDGSRRAVRGGAVAPRAR